ncbi:hypothetical protein [Dyella tabacisoli]|uniref:Uncharacterized protein n=1 Tax=Dyella tabacisoli TaxID=2282381 RepID=A0A369UP59_9GAMM|nr:hypothetical protein [Dyella tabacisoli]RDD82113.1 hypothetical protein DVJ77_08615 [Dyella tabacisoli]
MNIVPLANDASLNDIAARVYALKPKDPRLAEASKALAASNPHLVGDLSKLPTGTPIVVPALAGVDTMPGKQIDPKRDAVMAILGKLGQSVQQASAAQLTGAATADTSKITPQRAVAIDTLHTDIAAFIKLHG